MSNTDGQFHGIPWDAVFGLIKQEPSPAPVPIYCPAQTYAQTRDSPAEWCEEEVAEEGDHCPAHQEPDDDYDHYDYLQELKERQDYWGD